MIVVFGLGRETRELLRVLDRDAAGSRVLVLQEGPLAVTELPTVTSLDLDVRAEVSFDDATLLAPDGIEEALRSPGVSIYRGALRSLREAGVPLTTPTGRWTSARDGRDTIAITGTKGKSTTAALTAHLLAASGREVSLRGNIGAPALRVDDEPSDDVVIELSSYQLADLQGAFHVAGVTTLYSAHVPWHGDEARYHADKLRLLDLAQTRIVTRQVAEHPAIAASGGTGPRIDGVLAPPTDAVREAAASAGLVGEHFAVDLALALALVDAHLDVAAGVADLVEAIGSFAPLPHRLTPVIEHAGIRWVDDSISTVPESAVAAAEAYLPEGPVTLLLGGDDRDQDLAPLVTLLSDHRVRALLLPPLSERLDPALRPVAGTRVERVADLAAAVTRAAAVTPAGGCVLLSPAASSFSSYRDFQERGEHFVALVEELVGTG
jgi:UDP-N-acetylmuramoyl-L-alanine---L-glutamate ligase